ncbi:Fur family transcriptional regulator [Actibacterium pelagium]|uniref:ABC transporter ATP-binding protein n=1 Tax=Actibacterium pelagium TaxID=2029103 RepID=A0A917ABP9_9RHOB|nr:transcriptional repressor [Actibacterium pelagium]GGE39692.1 ABC transporter ATP-binding protein [Actibacterium pelagium]
MSAIGFEEHDHHHCIADAMQNAEALCATNSLKFTPTRRRVLEILLDRHQAMGAYDILEVLAVEGMGSQPPVAYRALDFLVSNGLAHKIERLNAYVACSHQGEDHTPGFMICTECKTVAEVPAASVRSILGEAASQTGFRVDRAMIEAEGVCANCQEHPA